MFLKVLLSITQVILKSTGWSRIVFVLTSSLSTATGGQASGFAIREYNAVGPISSSPCSQRNSWAHFGFSPLALISSNLLCCAISFNVPIFVAPGAYVLIFALRGFASTLAFVVEPARLFTPPGQVGQFLGRPKGPLTATGGTVCGSFAVEVPNLEESELVEVIKGDIVD